MNMEHSLFSPTFVIGSIRIGSVEGASCVNLGNNFPTDFQSHKKHNQGFGNIGGDNNTVEGARTSLEDSDLIDTLSVSNNDEIPDWVREMVTELSSSGMNTPKPSE
jgi:hypothetical protein